MKRLLCLLLCAGLVLSFSGWADTTLQQLERMEAHKTQPVPKVNMGDNSTQSNGKGSPHRNTSPSFELVLFMQGHCIHCKRFDPILKKYSEKTGLPVFAYTLDGSGAYPYENAVPAPQSVIQTFFGQRYPVATPTLFLVRMTKKDGLQAYPVFQGEATYEELSQQVERVLAVAGGEQ